MNRLFSTRRYYSKTSSHISLSLSFSGVSFRLILTNKYDDDVIFSLLDLYSKRQTVLFYPPTESGTGNTHHKKKKNLPSGQGFRGATADDPVQQSTAHQISTFPYILTTFLLSRRVVGRQAESLMSFCGHLLSPHVNCEPKSTDLPSHPPLKKSGPPSQKRPSHTIRFERESVAIFALNSINRDCTSPSFTSAPGTRVKCHGHLQNNEFSRPQHNVCVVSKQNNLPFNRYCEYNLPL